MGDRRNGLKLIYRDMGDRRNGLKLIYRDMGDRRDGLKLIYRDIDDSRNGVTLIHRDIGGKGHLPVSLAQFFSVQSFDIILVPKSLDLIYG